MEPQYHLVEVVSPSADRLDEDVKRVIKKLEDDNKTIVFVKKDILVESIELIKKYKDDNEKFFAIICCKEN